MYLCAVKHYAALQRITDQTTSSMKKSTFLLLILALLLASCASPRGVGNTREASKSQRYNQNRVGNQFIGVR